MVSIQLPGSTERKVVLPQWYPDETEAEILRMEVNAVDALFNELKHKVKLFIDNSIGGATATGQGEEVMKTVGSFLIVELMRQGHSPQEACEIGVKRIVANNANLDFQIGYLAIDKAGRVGAYSMDEGFVYTKSTNTETVVNQAVSYNK